MKFGMLAHVLVVLTSISMITTPVLGQEGGRPGLVSPTKKTADSRSVSPGAKSQVKDISFTATGQLILTVLHPSGKPSTGKTVSVVFESITVARAVTNANGKVVISGLKPGVHVIETGMTKTLVRFWHAELAPPQAVTEPAIVDMATVVRGQYGYGYGAPMAPGLVAATVTAIGIGAVVIGKNSSSGNSSPTTPASP